MYMLNIRTLYNCFKQYMEMRLNALECHLISKLICMLYLYVHRLVFICVIQKLI